MNKQSHQNEQRQLAQLWLEVQSKVFAFICTAVARRHDAEDLLQQVALETARSFHTYDQSRPFSPWVLTIARRCVARFYASQSTTVEIFDEDSLDLLVEYHVRDTRIGDEQLSLHECVELLDEKARRLLSLRYDDELTSVELAKATEMTTGSVRVVLSRIRRQLQNCVRSKLAGEELH